MSDTDTEVQKTDGKLADNLDYAGEPKVVQGDFVVAQHLDERRQNDKTGIYLDDVQREEAERRRAKLEGRKPDFNNPGTTASQPVYPVHQARTLVAGDVDVKADFQLPVVVGVHEDNVKTVSEAEVQRREAALNEAAAKDASPRTAPSGQTGADIAQDEKVQANS